TPLRRRRPGRARPAPRPGGRAPPPHAHGGVEGGGRRTHPGRHTHGTEAGPRRGGSEPLRRGRPQRPVPLRQRQEVQEVPRGGLTAERGTRNEERGRRYVCCCSAFRVPP